MIEKEFKKLMIIHDGYPIPLSRVKTLNAWRQHSHQIDVLFSFHKDYKRDIIDKLLYKMRFANDPCNINKRIIECLNKDKPELVIFIKPTNIKLRTIKYIKSIGCKTIVWSNDDMWGKHNRSIYFTRAAPYFDLVVTQKSYNCNQDELPSIGIRNILFQNKAFDTKMHYRVTSKYYKNLAHDIVFVGSYEKERLKALLFLAKNDTKIHIYGWGKKEANYHQNLIFHDEHLFGEEYAAVFNFSKISLNFLRRLNRDLQTSRSIEIPACGGFMLAERTTEHLSLFKEGIEADYFSTKEELLNKIRFYLSNDDLRMKIASNGYERCQKGNYDFDSRIVEIIHKIKQL